MINRYVDAVCQEICWAGITKQKSIEVDSIYFGGGTPTLLSTKQLDTMLDFVRRSFTVRGDCEISLEANPGTVSADSVKALFDSGFNRISFGMQSAHPFDLAILNRNHSYSDVVNAVKWSREAGFTHINLDLIFGIPGQTFERWLRNLNLVETMGVDHLSLYSLIIEEGTPLERWYGHGLLDLIDEDLTADMYEAAIDRLAAAGFEHYEISNWVKTDNEKHNGRCRHNMNTWRYQPYLGFGAGAHGFTGSVRTANVCTIQDYLSRMKKPAREWPAAETVIDVEVWEQMQEWMMLGLRVVNNGVNNSEFVKRFQVEMRDAFGYQIAKLLTAGLIEEKGENLRLTRKGIMLGNRVFAEFVGNEKPGSFVTDQ